MHFKNWLQTQIAIIKAEFTSEPPLKIVKNYAYIVLGAFLVSVSDAFFLIPLNIISGGATSLSIIAHAIPGLSVLPATTYVIILNWFFFLLGLFFLGLSYSIKTLVYTIVHPMLVLLFTYLIDIVTIDGVRVLDMTQTVPLVINDSLTISAESMLPLSYLIGASVGGLILGAGIGICMSGGGSSGGTDVLNLMMHKFWKMRVGTASLMTDAIIIFSGFFVNGHNLVATLVGILSAIFCAIMIDRVFLGHSQYYMALIISEKWEEINDHINNKLGRGSTLLVAKGGYTDNPMNVIEVCFDRRDYSIISGLVTLIDPNAFVTVFKAQEIIGFGFTGNKKTKANYNIDAMEARKLIVKARQADKMRPTTDDTMPKKEKNEH